MYRLTLEEKADDFLSQIMNRSGQNLRECLQCGKCTGGCPIASEDVGGPRQLIGLILMGLEEQALNDPTWLYCVSCGTCATRCPVEINMYQVATALCEIAERKKVKPIEPEIHLFEKIFLNSVRRQGRVQELKTVVEFNLRTFNPFKSMSQGITLMLKGAFSPFDMLGIKGKKNKSVSKIFSKSREINHAG
jgi:heterodisulfide reductase subunit C2